MKLMYRLLFFALIVSMLLLSFFRPELYNGFLIGVSIFLLAIICAAGITVLVWTCMNLAEMKKVQDNMKLLEKNRDAKACTANFEAMLEKKKKSGKKDTRVAELNVIFGMMYCGEHDRADAMLAEIARTFDERSIETDDGIKYGYFAVFRKMAEQDWEGAYEAMQRLRSEHDIEKESILDDNLQFFEIKILRELGREEESREKAVRLLGHKVLPCIAAKLDAG